ncbi:hypothetical protein PtB15_1B403 [Puccinia triticina]|nr:hypothetical protein PtB15_1B403 [Puccinia triticina]
MLAIRGAEEHGIRPAALSMGSLSWARRRTFWHFKHTTSNQHVGIDEKLDGEPLNDSVGFLAKNLDGKLLDPSNFSVDWAMRTAINTASGYPPAGPRPLSRDTCTCTGAEFPCNSNHWNSPNFAVTTTPSPFLAFPSAPAQHILYTDEFDAILKRPLARHAKRRQ